MTVVDRPAATRRRPLLSIVTPVYNEAATVPIFYERLVRALEPLRARMDLEIIFSNNRSTDATEEAVLALRARDPRVQLLTMSRNFGYQGSMVAGLRQALGDAIVLIDVDCEDPPELLPRFIEAWEQGHDVVYGIRERRAEPWAVTAMRRIFYRVNRMIADSDILVDVAEFGVMSAAVRDAVTSGLSTFPFIRAEIAHYGFRRLGIRYDRQPRTAGRSHFNFYAMARFAVAGILTSTTVPLRLALYLLPLVFLVNLGLLWLEASGRWGMAFETLVSLDFMYVSTVLAFVSLYTARNYRNVVGRPIAVVDWRRSAVNLPPEESPNFLPRRGPVRPEARVSEPRPVP
jgi:polyisoprenyl-phosphate glycosyltransferase